MTRNSTRLLPTLLACATGALQAACAVPGTVGVAVEVPAAPPPPPVVVVVDPALEPVAGGVYVATNPAVSYDMFRFGATWYLYSGSYWYQAPSARGPFAAIDVRHVPRPVLEVPRERWKHHPHGGPPGLARRGHGRDD
jgi:hypothetical protein